MRVQGLGILSSGLCRQKSQGVCKVSVGQILIGALERGCLNENSVRENRIPYGL